jgi:hypothetical protein
VPGASQVGGNITITAAAGALQAGDTFSLAIQEPGVTFTAAGPPEASLTAGNLTLTSAAGTLDAGDDTATWTVQGTNTVATTIVIGPIYYDVAAGAHVGDTIGIRSSGDGAFVSQTVANGALVSTTNGLFTAPAPPVSTSSSSPVVEPGQNVSYTETAAGSLPANNSAIVLLAPYANQIAAYRATFAAPPTALVTGGGMVLGAPIINSQTISVTTASGVVSAPPQTVAIFPVTTASTGTPSQVTFSNLSYQLGNLVPPGALVGLGTADTGTGVVTATSTAVGGTAIAGNQYTDAINGNGLGSAASGDTTPPDTFIDAGPADGSTVFDSSTVTFYFHSSEDPNATFTCTLISHTDAGDSSTVFEHPCGQPSGSDYSKTYPSLANGQYTFYVQATDAANNTDPTPASSSFSVGFDNTPPTVTIGTPKSASSSIPMTFSEPVKSVAASDLSVTPMPAGGITITCLDGTATADCTTGPVTSVAVAGSPYLTPGQSYTVTANPAGAATPITDLAGNPLAQTNRTFRASTAEQESSAAAVTRWRTVKAAAASGGSYAEEDLAGATASYAFTGTTVSWRTVTGPAEGRATVYVDGAKKASVNNYAKHLTYGVVRSVSGLSAGPHVVEVVVAGKKGVTTASDTMVAVDGFTVGSTTTQDSSAAVRYGWGTVASSHASAGHYAVSAQPGAQTTFTFAGSGVTWVTVTGPSMGRAAVYIDGVKKATIDGYSSSARYGVKHAFKGLATKTHTVRIVVLGTHRSGAKGSQVAVDEWLVS